MAHDAKIVQRLPMDLQMEFPAILTHKAAISKTVADLLRPCVQNSVGPERFQKIISELHFKMHDRLELQYLIFEYQKRSGIGKHLPNSLPPPQTFSSFKDQNQYAGYVPSGVYFRIVYTEIIKMLRPKMDKHTMLLDGKVLKGDHSFKFSKHMAKLGEASAFTGLYTVNNEYEEIVHQILVPSKSLSYLKHSFEKMREAYVTYGHQMPVVFFTDNVKSDKTFLEGMFTSLKEGTQPMEEDEINYGEPEGRNLALPSGIVPIYKNRKFDEIDHEMSQLIRDIEHGRHLGINAVVGFDCEWKFPAPGDVVDTIQLAYGEKIFVLHVDRAWPELPPNLVSLLENSNILKVGRNVEGDLKRVSKAFNIICAGKEELLSLCTSRRCLPSTSTSLSDISYKVLRYNISKSQRETNWLAPILTNDQINYAALDAWAGLLIYNELINKPIIGARINDNNCIPGTFVAVKPQGRTTPVAFGQIIQSSHNVNRTCEIQVLRVDVPGYVIDNGRIVNSVRSNSRVIDLGSRGSPPFNIVVRKADLLIEVNNITTANNNPTDDETSVNELIETEQEESEQECTEPEVNAVFREMFKDSIENVNADNFKHGYTLLSTISLDAETLSKNNGRVYSRILKDIFHLMDMIRPYKRHGLYKEFTQRFSDSLFIMDEEDKKAVEEVLIKNGESWELKMKYDRSWVLKRVKRKVAPPQVLLPLLKALFLSFGPLKCPKSKRTLFDHTTWKKAVRVLKTVQLGHVSDPPGVQLYYKTGKTDKDGLTLYRCIRGTNSLEGGVHQNLVRKFGSFGAGPELADAMLTEYRLRHNLNVGTVNRYGRDFEGHYDPWLVQHIDFLRKEMNMTDLNGKHLAVDINALRYSGSNEVYGICPFPDEEMSKIRIEKPTRDNDVSNENAISDVTIPRLRDTVFTSIDSTARGKNSRYHYIAQRQNTKYAVVSVHNLEEKTLFTILKKELFPDTEPGKSRIPNFDRFAYEWNSKTDGDTIFYKTPEQLENYFGRWKEQNLAKDTHQILFSVIESIKNGIKQSNSPSLLPPAVSPVLPVVSNPIDRVVIQQSSLPVHTYPQHQQQTAPTAVPFPSNISQHPNVIPPLSNIILNTVQQTIAYAPSNPLNMLQQPILTRPLPNIFKSPSNPPVKIQPNLRNNSSKFVKVPQHFTKNANKLRKKHLQL
jgi:hypothetical protein